MRQPLPSFSLRVLLAKPSQDGREIRATLEGMTKPNEHLRKGISLGMGMLAFQAQKERFTGKGPFAVSAHRLGVVTGRLRRDLHAEAAEMTGNGIKGRIGSAVEYFGVHELGYEGNISIRAHSRKAHTLAERPIASKKGKVRIRPAQSRLEQSVRAHSRKVKIPERRPLRSAIEQHSTRILSQQISAALATIHRTPKPL